MVKSLKSSIKALIFIFLILLMLPSIPKALAFDL